MHSLQQENEEFAPEPFSDGISSEAAWTATYVNNLPDSSFAFISSGGKKDSSGKTTPRGLRHLPYRDATGKPDPAHVRNALARLPQTKGIDQADAKSKLLAAAKTLGIGDNEIEDLMTTGLVREVQLREFTLEEKLEWLAEGALQRLKEFNKSSGTNGGKFYYVKMIHPTISGNYREYTGEELKRFARTLIGKQADVNHGEHLADTTIVDAEYSDKEKAVEGIVYSQNSILNQLYKDKQIIGASIEADPRFSQKSENGLLTTPKGMIGKGIAFVTSGETPGDPTTKVELIETVLKNNEATKVTYLDEHLSNQEQPPQFVKQNKAPIPRPQAAPDSSSGGKAPPAPDVSDPDVNACIMKLTSMGVDSDDASLLCQNAKAGGDGNDGKPAGNIKQISRDALGDLPTEQLRRLADKTRTELLEEHLDEAKRKWENFSIQDALRGLEDFQNLQAAVSKLSLFMPSGDGSPQNYADMKSQILGEFKAIQIKERQEEKSKISETIPLTLKDRIQMLDPQDKVKFFKHKLRETPLAQIAPPKQAPTRKK